MKTCNCWVGRAGEKCCRCGEAAPNYMDLEHGSTVVVATNAYELAYIMAWCVRHCKAITPFISAYNKFPFCISVSGNVVGWTDSMDRALYYKPFMEFVSDI